MDARILHCPRARRAVRLGVRNAALPRGVGARGCARLGGDRLPAEGADSRRGRGIARDPSARQHRRSAGLSRGRSPRTTFSPRWFFRRRVVPPLARPHPGEGYISPMARLRLFLLVAAAGASPASGSGGDSPLAAFGGSVHQTNSTDAAFLRSMTEHEKASLGITRLAQRRALRAELRGMADNMTSEQLDELRQLGRLARGLGSGGPPPAPAAGRPASTALVDLT